MPWGKNFPPPRRSTFRVPVFPRIHYGMYEPPYLNVQALQPPIPRGKGWKSPYYMEFFP